MPAFGDRSPFHGRVPSSLNVTGRIAGRFGTPTAPCTVVLAALLGLASPASARDPAPGPLTAQSIRGEPLRAVIALGSERDGPPPALRISPAATYARIGQARDPTLEGVRLDLATQPDGQRFLALSGVRPVEADELVLVLETTDGSLRRLYRLRLGSREPADRVNVRPVEPIDRIAAPGATVAGTAATRTPEGVGVRGAPTASRGSVSSAAAAPTAASTSLRPTVPLAPASPARVDDPPRPAAPSSPRPVRPAVITILEEVDLETLAAEFRPADATLEQAAIAFWRLNRPGLPGRPPRPGAGTRLVVPTEDEMRAIDPQDARRFMAALARPAAAAPPGHATR